MPMIRKSSLWAFAIICIALLGAFDIIPQNLAEFSVIALPALATAVLILPAAKSRSCWGAVR